jgi:putative inorganic carbon (HCO3(-)) transporter
LSREVIVYGLSLLAMLAVLILTKSRGAWLGAAVGLALVLIYRWPGLRRAALVALVAGVAATLAIGPAQVVQALASTPALGGWSGRLELWSRALDAIADYPFTGIGMGTFDRVVPLRYPYVLLAGAELAIPHAHNLLLQVAVDLGLPGAAAMAALWACVLGSALRAIGDWERMGERDLALHAAALAAGLIAVLVHGLIDAASWGAKPAIIIWGVMGLLMAHRAVSVQSRATERQPAVNTQLPAQQGIR